MLLHPAPRYFSRQKGFRTWRTTTPGGRRAEAEERNDRRTIRVAIEVREDAVMRRLQITAPSIERALIEHHRG